MEPDLPRPPLPADVPLEIEYVAGPHWPAGLEGTVRGEAGDQGQRCLTGVGDIRCVRGVVVQQGSENSGIGSAMARVIVVHRVILGR